MTDELTVALQKQRKMKVRVNILNYDFSIIERIEKITTEYSFNIDATSDIRRTCSVKLYNLGNKYTHSYLLNKYVQVYVGIKNNKTNEYVYTNMGIYLINNPTTAYSATDNSVTIEGIDLMAKLTGLRNGNLVGLSYQIPMYSNIRTAMIATLAVAGFTKYVITDVDQYVPYDITIDIGGTVYDILSQLRDILPNYQIYFDVDGVFHYNLIPSGYQEQVSIGTDVFNKLAISSSVNTDYSTVKNTVEVFGKTHENCYIGGIATLTESTNKSLYSVTIADLGTLANNIKIKFTTPSTVNVSYPYLKINALEELKIYDINAKNSIFKLEADKTYVLLYTSGMLEINADGFQIDETGGSYTIDFPLTCLQGSYEEDLILEGTNSAINVSNFVDGNVIYMSAPNDFYFGELGEIIDGTNRYIGYSTNQAISNVATSGTNIAPYSTFYYEYDPLLSRNLNHDGSINLNIPYAKEIKDKESGTYSISFSENTGYTRVSGDDTVINSNSPMFILSPLSTTIAFDNTKQYETFDILLPLQVKKAFTTSKDKRRLKNYEFTNIHFIFDKTVDIDFFTYKYLVKFDSTVDIKSYKSVIEKYYDVVGKKKVYSVSYYYNISTADLTFIKIPKWEDVTFNSIVYLNNKAFQIGTGSTITKNTTYKLKFVDFTNNNYFTMLGDEQPHGIAQDNNTLSPFYVGGEFGIVRIVLSGGDYDNIYSDSLAQERADWELYNRCKLQDSITITCVPIFYADVNTLIEFIEPVSGNAYKYIIKAISTSGGVDGTQTLQCIRYYPYYVS